jgi:fructokinase
MAAPLPVVFGEVLFDRFPGEAAVLGGAPFNVAWNLQGLGLSPLFVSRVGDDESGADVLARMRAHGMRTDGVQLDVQRPTGAVEVTLEGGQPSYEILPDQAYDHVDPSEMPEISEPRLLYHGSLALRHPVSRQGFAALRDKTQAPRFVDVNLRAPWCDRDFVCELIEGAAWVKLNGDELNELSGDCTGELLERAQHFRDRYGIGSLVLTLGAEGACVLANGEDPHHVRPEGEIQVVDTVGAGDAFASVLILGIVRGWTWSVTLERAQQFAAAICTLRGATVDDTRFYSRFAGEWN